MPIHDYTCRACGETSELLVLGSAAAPRCPACGSDELERLLSLPAVSSETTRGLAMRAAKRRDAAQGQERVAAQREYERNHD
jgi:putative FmdB family regulatory protein